MQPAANVKRLSPEEELAAAQEIQEIYRQLPHMFVRDVLGDTCWYMQDEIVKSTFVNKVTAVKTCNAVGKSFIAARVALTFLSVYSGSIVVTTAPTWRQVKDVLWREFAVAVKRSKVKLTKKEVKQAGLDISEDWFAVGLSTKYPENFFGYHADHILVIVDEAGGVEEPIFKGVAAITPNMNARVLLIGNPTNPSGTFFDYFEKKSLGAKCFTISAFDSPNFTSTGIKDVETLVSLFTPPEGVGQADWTRHVNAKLQPMMNPRFSALIDPATVYERFNQWGTDSSAWESLVMGEFPSQAEQSLIPTNLVRMAMNMYGIDDETGKSYAEISGWEIPDGPAHYGQDMARFGNDLNVNTPTHGGWVEKQIVWNKKGDAKKDLVESAETILNIIDQFDSDVIVNIDDTGNGGGTTDHLHYKNRESQKNDQPAHQYRLNPYVFGSKEMMTEKDKEKYADITSMLYWNLRDWFYTKHIALYWNQQLFDELVGRRWGIDKNGRIKVESKEEYKKRTGGKSPDRSDSLVLAFARKRPDKLQPILDTPAEIESMQQRTQLTAQNIRPVTGGLDPRY